jgi:NADH-quinone oxidoreductase subunit N
MINNVALLPLYASGGTALLVLIAELAVGKRAAVAGSLLAGAVATVVCAIVAGGQTFCSGDACSWVVRPIGTVAAVLFASLTAGVLALSLPGLRLGTAPAGEFCFLLACSMTGGVVIGYAGDLITLIVGLETLTLPLYVLVGLRRPTSAAGASAAVTFLLISVVSTTLSLMGAALLYAATGALHLSRLGSPPPASMAALGAVGSALIVVGFAFKVAAVPLHAWAPATYDGAPLPVAAYLSTASKLGGVLALALVAAELDVGPLVAVLAVATMTVGNLVALRQTRMVRLLAWSSVAQAGYIIAPLSLGAPGVTAGLAYAAFFVVLEFLAFGAIVGLRPAGASGGALSEYRGAARRSPWLGAAFVLALAGLAGLPPGLAGLFAKVTIVDALIGHGWGWLAAVVAVNAVVALAYYVRVAATLYASPPAAADESFPAESSADATAVAGGVAVSPAVAAAVPVAVALWVFAAAAVVLGFAPQLLFDRLTR